MCIEVSNVSYVTADDGIATIWYVDDLKITYMPIEEKAI